MHINYTEQLFYCYNVSFVLLVILYIISKCPSSRQYVDMSKIEVLLEVGASRRILKTTSESLLLVLERELGSVGLDGVLALSPSACESTDKKVFVLQRWVDRWHTFVDVTDKAQVKDGDKLTLVCKPAADMSTSSAMDKVAIKRAN